MTTTPAPPESPPDDAADWVAVGTLTRLEAAYLRPAERKAGRVDRTALRARMVSASGAELAKMRNRGETVAIRTVATGRGRLVVTTEVAGREEARAR